MTGLTFYPYDEYETKDSEKLEKFKDKWLKDKKDLIGDDYFIASGDLSEKARQMISDIKSQNVTMDDFLYDPKKLFDLLCAYTHLATKKKKSYEDIKTLTTMLDSVIKAGANIEEVKFLALASVFFNIDPMLDRKDGDYDIAMSKVEFSLKLARVIGILAKYSPYETMFEKSLSSRVSPNEDTRGAVAVEFCNYDTNNLEYISDCKLNSMLLEAILNYRFDYKDFDKSVLAEEFFKTRKVTEDNVGKNKDFFKYEIRDSAKEAMHSLFCSPSYDKYANIGAKFSADRLFTPDVYLVYRSIATVKSLSEFSKEYKAENQTDNKEKE